MDDCIFCRIAAGEVDSDVVYRDESVTAFRDLQPAAPVHILIVPNQHVGGATGLLEEHSELAGRLMVVAAELARREGIAEDGYRLIVNAGRDGGQVIQHLHLHLLGGRRLGPMG